MADRLRVNVTLTQRQWDDLNWLATERTAVPTALARALIEAGIAAALEDAALRARYLRDQAGQSVQDAIMPDLLTALSVRGVPEVLSGKREGASLEQIRVASWLVRISRYLTDSRHESVKGPPPRLDTYAHLYIPYDDVGAALDVAGGADGLAVRQGQEEGTQGVTDKRQLSVIGGGDPGEVPGGEG